MIRHLTLVALIAAVFARGATAQHVTISPNPVLGGVFSVTVTNLSTAPITVPNNVAGIPFRIYTPEGDLVYAQTYPSDFLIFTQINPGQSTTYGPLSLLSTMPFPLPQGHYFFEVWGGFSGTSSIGQFTVGSPGTPAPKFLFRRRNAFYNYLEYPGASEVIRISNGTNTVQVLTDLGWTVTQPAASGTVASGNFFTGPLGIQPGQTVEFPWPSAGLPATGQTLQLQTAWMTGTGSYIYPLLEIAGPRPTNTLLTADLFFPLGRQVPLNGALPIDVRGKADSPFFQWMNPSNTSFALLFSLTPGSIPLPGGAVLPLGMDPLLAASVAGNLAPYLFNSPGALTPPNAILGTDGVLGRGYFLHPGPAVSGLAIQVAAVTYTPSTWYTVPWQASPLRTLKFQ